MRERPETAGRAERPAIYGVEAEIERLMRCPECGSKRVSQVREGFGGGYGFFGFKAIGDFGAPKQVQCRNCGHEWLRPPMRELRREAERRIDERYDALDVENERLRRQLANYVAYQQDIDRGLLSPPAEDPQPAAEPDGEPDAGSEPVGERADPSGPDGRDDQSVTPAPPEPGN